MVDGARQQPRDGLQAGVRMRGHDHAGVGHLELFDEHGRLAAWRFTLGQNLHAIRLTEQFTPLLDTAF